MLLTITNTGKNATDLGYLLHKNPARPQTAVFSFGKAHVFYPEATLERCTAALLLDIDPLDLSRGKPGSQTRGLFDYVNDRPYVSSSFMSTAISKVFGTAMAGRCEKKPALADAVLNLSATLTMLPCRGSTAMLEKVFAPLGYELSWEEFPLDDHFPEWGLARYVNLHLRAKLKLMHLLRHIYVLIPVFDNRKHYWIGDDEVDKLLSHGEGWLESHPEKNFITRRYFSRLNHYTRIALERMERIERLDNGEGSTIESDMDQADEGTEVKLRLKDQRLAAVVSAIKACGAKSVIDLGCGEGVLLQMLVKENCFAALAGSDVSLSALERAADKNKQLVLFQGSVCYRDKRFKGYDAAVVMEVIEHLDESRLPCFSSVIFGDTAPKTVIITTPNIEYNINYLLDSKKETLSGQKRFRHPDHRFEWNRAQFRSWAEAAASRYGYSLRIEEIGQRDEERGTPTQMGVFSKRTGLAVDGGTK